MFVFFRFILKLKSDLVKSDLDPTILIENFDHVTVKSLIKYLYYDSGNMDCRVSERNKKLEGLAKGKSPGVPFH